MFAADPDEAQQIESWLTQRWLGVPMWIGLAGSLGFMVIYRMTVGRWPVLRLFTGQKKRRRRRSRR